MADDSARLCAAGLHMSSGVYTRDVYVDVTCVGCNRRNCAVLVHAGSWRHVHHTWA